MAEENSPVDCFCRRGNERKRGDRHGSAETKSLRAGQRIRLHRKVRPYFFTKNEGIRTRREPPDRWRKKTVRWTVFADAATSVSEAIGTAVPRQNPFGRAKRILKSLDVNRAAFLFVLFIKTNF